MEKFRLAKAAGFRAVEMACPDQFSKDEVVAAQKENGLDVVLINVSLGETFQKDKKIIAIYLLCN